MKHLRRFTSVVVVLLISLMVYKAMSTQVSAQESKSSSVDAFSAYVDKHGNISIPKEFRLKMIHLGSWLVPKGEASGFHDVYTERSSARFFRKNGSFPDGATIIKELRPAHVGNYTTGANVSYASTKVKQWFIMIKDTKGRFKSNKNWGDGWGWCCPRQGICQAL